MPRCGLWLYGMGRPQQGYTPKYCRLSGTGEDDAHLPYACSQNRACSEQKSSRETSIDMSCRNESIVFENRVAAYANLVVRLEGGRPTHDNNTCRVFSSQESHCFSGGSVKLRAYLEIDKRRLQRKRAETDTSVPALIFITQMTKTCSMVCQFPTYSSAIIPYSEPPRRNSIRSPLSFSNVAKYSESVVV